MSNLWAKTKAGKQAIEYLFDSRPVWLYSLNDDKALWNNSAARLLNATQKTKKLNLAPNLTLANAQIEHMLKLGLIGRKSLARLEFLDNKKSIFITCSYIVQKINNNEDAVLIIGVDPIKKPIVKKNITNEAVIKDIFSEKIGYAILDNKEKPIAGSSAEIKQFNKAGMSYLQPNDNDILQFPLKDNDNIITIFLNPIPKITKSKPREKRKSVKKPAKPQDLTPLIDEKNIKTEDIPTISQTEGFNDDAVLWQVVGSGFVENIEQQKPTQQQTKIDKSASHNFEKLSEILRKETAKNDDKNEIKKTHNAKETSKPSSLVNIPQETLLLNRLPIGLLIFRDQKIIFANREMLKMTNYDSLADFKNAGLASLFPSSSDKDSEPSVGPITHLVKSNASLFPVGARLQIINWQNKSSFLLSAINEEIYQKDSFDDNIINSTFVTRQLLTNLAKFENQGFLLADRHAKIIKLNDKAIEMLNHPASEYINQRLSELISPNDINKLSKFLEIPTKADQVTPSIITLKTHNPKLEMLLFAESYSNIVQSYFALLREIKISPSEIKKPNSGIDPKSLEKISRAMRRPLNTILGFSELITSQQSSNDDTKYDEYARDIKFAGHEILDVIDDMEMLTQLNNDKYEPTALDFDLTMMLEKCIFKTRKIANDARVLIRSAISSQLGLIKADAASLEQAILNLIASAIEQTPIGEQVIISAQTEDDKTITIHVRNSGASSKETSDNFTLFRQGLDHNGKTLKPVTSSVGLSLTRSLLAINTCTLSVNPIIGVGTLFSLVIPANLTSN